ncbi:PREDICTED: radical S-adenosyl methionine domain-containing protein 2 [Bison bison bison]|uniref:S-adenosylmethionine-dependent nucleotide dehydratase RSAD2 n=1 Tax=Bison bison bison TaxID=43346 RepID=A0A6P3IEM6_BISBB|nr:PREDICTED: radical S-adenosyl methionine domain-containing protein 2 [Bison bison bison]XP_061289364.1 S-adenosylmethionine-dependent nucleotide dehydratase RSAD2 [Bos javanicus]
MWMLVPIAFALKLLNVFLQPLGSVWSSLGPLFLQLRAASWLAGGERSRLLQDRREAGEPGRAEGEDGGDLPTTPTSVNYHFTRQCNYKCGFCFHTAKTSFVLPLEEAKKGLLMLKEAGMEKINFSGGEPFLQDRGEYLGRLVKFCKQELQLPSVSIVSNGSLIRERWFQKYGEYLDILAISCDSFDEQVNVLIGRGQGKKNHVENLQKLRTWCKEYRVAFKINSVINRFNVDEDMKEQITALNPVRWKVFQCLIIEGENSGEDALREAERFVISDEEFEAFLDRHKDVSCLVPESNQKMRDSYLILDEYMRFLNCRNGRKDPSKSILDVGVEEAIKFSGFDEKMFLKRGGKYVWSKADLKLDW